MTQRFFPIAFAGLCFAGCWLVPARAGASMAFPEVLRDELGLDAIPGPAPGCKLCHLDDVGGLKTAVKPFGLALRAAGTVGGSVPSLRSSLGSLEATGTDSDGDSVGDIDELRAGTDPNTPEGDDVHPLEQVPLPQTGCVIAPGSQPDGLAAALALAALVSLQAARRRKWRRAQRSPA